MTEEERYQAYKAQKLREEQAFQQYKAEQSQPEFEEPPIMARVGRGMMDVGQGIKQAYLEGTEALGLQDEGTADAYTDEVNSELELYDRGRGEDAGIDWARMGGQMAPFAPLAVGATIPRMIAAGAAEGGAMFAPQGADSIQKAGQVGLGGAAGGVLGFAAPYASAAAAKGAGKLKMMIGNLADRFTPATADDIGNVLDKALDGAGINLNEVSDQMAARINRDVVDALRAGDIEPAAAARRAVMKEIGFSGETAPTRAQLSRKASQWRDEQELSKLTGGEALKQRYVNQGNKFREISDELRTNIGGNAPDDIAAAQGSFDDILKQWDDSQTAVGEAYARARMKAPETTVTLDRFKAEIDELVELGEDSVSPQVTAASTMLRNKGMSGESLRHLDMEQVENLRKTLTRRMGDAIKSHDANAVRVVRQLTNAIDDDIAGAGDVFAVARDTARQRFEKFSGESVSRITRGAGNETNFINTKIIGGKPEDIANIRQTHMNGRPQTWVDIKGRVYEFLMDKAYQGNAGSESGIFSGKMLGKALDGRTGIGNSRLKEIFTPDELSQLRMMAKSGEWMVSEVPFAGTNTSNTASALVRTVQGAGKLPIMDKVGNAVKTVQAKASLDKVPPMESKGSMAFMEILKQHKAGRNRLRDAAMMGMPVIPGETSQHSVSGDVAP